MLIHKPDTNCPSPARQTAILKRAASSRKLPHRTILSTVSRLVNALWVHEKFLLWFSQLDKWGDQTIGRNDMGIAKGLRLALFQSWSMTGTYNLHLSQPQCTSAEPRVRFTLFPWGGGSPNHFSEALISPRQLHQTCQVSSTAGSCSSILSQEMCFRSSSTNVIDFILLWEWIVKTREHKAWRSHRLTIPFF